MKTTMIFIGIYIVWMIIIYAGIQCDRDYKSKKEAQCFADTKDNNCYESLRGK